MLKLQKQFRELLKGCGFIWLGSNIVGVVQHEPSIQTFVALYSLQVVSDVQPIFNFIPPLTHN